MGKIMIVELHKLNFRIAIKHFKNRKSRSQENIDSHSLNERFFYLKFAIAQFDCWF